MADSSSELHLEIETLERKHAENPEGRFFVPLANAYRKMGDVETAEALLRSGVERHPDYLSAHIVLGRCLADRGEIREAEAEFRYVLLRDPQNLIALRTLGELAAADQRPAEASEWYRELLAVDPMNEEARQALDTLGSTAESAPERAADEARAAQDWWKEPSTGEVPPVEGLEPTTFGAAIDPDPDVEEVAGEDTGTETVVETTIVWSDETVGFAREEDDVAEDPDEEGPFSVPTPEVVTETIAELYTRQGLHERAAGVYRELIRRRGGDASLEARLAEVERLARGDSAGSEGELVLTDEEALPTPALDGEAADAPAADALPQDAPWTSTSEEEEDDAFAASVADGLAALHLEADDDSTAASEPPPSSDDVVAAEEERGQGTIGDLLSSIARWRPAAPAAGNTPAAAPAEDAPTIEDLSSYAAEPAPGEALGLLQGTVEEEDPSAVLDDLSFLAPDRDDLAPLGTAPADDEPFPWEVSDAEEHVVPAAELEAAAASAASDEPAVAPSEASASAGAGDDRSEVADEPAADAAGDERAAASAHAVDDEDLESFQAWLRSLKR